MKTNLIRFNPDAGVAAVLKALAEIRDRTFDRTRVPMHKVRWVPTGPTSGRWER